MPGTMNPRTRRNTFAGLAATLTVAIAALGFSAPAMAAPSPAPAESITMPDGSTFDSSTLTEEDWNTAVDELIASDAPRTTEETFSETLYTFEIPVESATAPDGTFEFTVAVPKDDVVTPRLGGGSDSYGPYILLNEFDQNLLIGGGGAAITAGLCAIPAIGWISCAAITAAVVVAATWLSVNGTCPQNFKAYIGVPERNACVNY